MGKKKLFKFEKLSKKRIEKLNKSERNIRGTYTIALRGNEALYERKLYNGHFERKRVKRNSLRTNILHRIQSHRSNLVKTCLGKRLPKYSKKMEKTYKHIIKTMKKKRVD